METEMGGDIGSILFWIIPTAVKFRRNIPHQISMLVGSVPICQDDGTSAMFWKESYGVIVGISP
jgi:hypothetical protein